MWEDVTGKEGGSQELSIPVEPLGPNNAPFFSWESRHFGVAFPWLPWGSGVRCLQHTGVVPLFPGLTTPQERLQMGPCALLDLVAHGVSERARR